MFINPRAVELTRNFYQWELRGRGWATYPHCVALEPPFRPFTGLQQSTDRPSDDARRETWLSSLLTGLRGEGRVPAEALVPTEGAVSEPDPMRSEPVEMAELLVGLPEDARVSQVALLSWLRSLSTASGPFSFELLGAVGRVETRLALPKRDASHVKGQIEAALPSAVVLPARHSLQERWTSAQGQCLAAVEFGLASEFVVPLASFGRHDEPLLPLVAALADVGLEELGLFQVLFEETREPWERSLLRAVVTPSGQPFFADAPEITALAKEKVSSPLFAVAVRIGARATSGERAWEILQRIAAGLSHFGNPHTNELMPLPNDDLEALESDLLDRTTHRSGMLLSGEELMSLVHLPGAGIQVPGLWRAAEKTKAPPREVITGTGCYLGANEHHAMATEVRLSVDTKTKHVHVVGSSGTGKSTLLVRMILEDIEAGHGVGVLDPHGDLIEEVAARIPDGRLSDVVFFDPSEDDTAIGWNILGASSEVEKGLLASDLVGVFRRLSTSWGDQMTAVLANAVLVFLESDRGGTLEDLRRFLVDAEFRKGMLDTVADRHVASFWETEYPLLIGRKPQAPILTRLDTFLRSKLVRRVVTVRNPKLDFRDVTDRGYIFLGKLAAGAIGEENAALLGSLLVSKFHQVSLARESQMAEERRPFFLYIDEFHHVATSSMASLFSGMRKYRLGLTVAHQDLYQLHRSVPEVERSLLANAYTRICFRVAEEDARQLSKGFSLFEAEDLMKLGLGEAICRTGGRDDDFNLQTENIHPIDVSAALERKASLRELSSARWLVSDENELEPALRVSEAATNEAATLDREKREPAESAPVETADPAQEVTGAAEPMPQLNKKKLDYLESVAVEPFLSVRERNNFLGLSSWKGQRIKKDLLEAQLLREVPVNPGGRGERFKLVELTTAGRQVLDDYRIATPSGFGRGGIAHQWWVKTIGDWLEDQGVPATIEDESRGARVDILASSGRRRIAIEVEMAEGHALENIRKDLNAGFDLVVTLLDDSISLERIKEASASQLEDAVRPKVHIGRLQEHEEILAPPLTPIAAPLRPPNRNEEPRRRRRRKPRRSATRPSLSDALSEPGALSTPLAAEYVGLSPATLETMRIRGGGPPFSKLGRRVVYRREDLDEWLTERRRASTSDDSGGS